MQWLLEDTRPNYHSISDFRKNNPLALKNLFKLFVSFLKEADLIGCQTIAIDGTKSRAHNSKKANFNQKKIDNHIEYIETKTQEYLDALEENDAKENPEKIKNIQQKIERLKQNKIRYELLEEKLKASGEPQISTIDSDAKENLGIETYTALVDKGYHNGREIEACKQANIITIVAQPEQGKNKEKHITKDYLVSKFQYDQTTDSYTCPQGEMLKTTGHWHKKTTDRESYMFKRYRTPKCRECPVKHLCTSRMAGRDIDRSQYADAVEENNKRYGENPQLYRKRQEINEHIFRTIKRQWRK